MKIKTIEIIVTPEGKSSVQTLGFTGSSCRDASRFIEQALGQRTAETLTTGVTSPLNLSAFPIRFWNS